MSGRGLAPATMVRLKRVGWKEPRRCAAARGRWKVRFFTNHHIIGPTHRTPQPRVCGSATIRPSARRVTNALVSQLGLSREVLPVPLACGIGDAIVERQRWTPVHASPTLCYQHTGRQKSTRSTRGSLWFSSSKDWFFFSHSYNDHVDMASSDSNTNVHDEHAADAANHSDPALEIDVRFRPACLAISVCSH